jgi:hypothetical protein
MSWMILCKKQLFDLEIKGQGSTKVIMVRDTTLWSCIHIPNIIEVMHPHTKYHWPISKDKNVMARTRKYYLKNNYLTLRSLWYVTHRLGSCTHILEWYYLKNNYLTLRSKIKVSRRSLWYTTHRLMDMHPHTKYHWPISKDKNVMSWTRKYYLKNNYLTLSSKVKVPRRWLWYATHRLMVMHPQTKYNWLTCIWKNKKDMVQTSFAEKKQKQKKWKKKSD